MWFTENDFDHEAESRLC